MRRTLIVSGVITMLVLVFGLYIEFSYKQQFQAPVTGIVASKDTNIIARGKYLVMGPAHCWNCHMPGAKESLQQEPKKGLAGGTKIDLPFGTLYTPNITSDKETGIGRFTDEQLAAAVRYSVKHNKQALIPFMTYNNMTDEDLQAVISYLRATSPVKNRVPGNNFNMLGKTVLRFMIKPVTPLSPAKAIKRDTSAAYGKYLAFAVANCNGCHTNRSKTTGEFIGEPFAGGYEMAEKNATFTTPNLTPHQSTGRISDWPVKQFVARFRSGAVYPGTPMPWKAYQKMSDNDLKALYYFLKSLTPVENRVNVYKEREDG